jgi:SAM-dependent methyltransferase
VSGAAAHDPSGFYDGLASDYHLIHEDWPGTVEHQARVLVPLLRRLGVPAGGRVLDASCGIGTQALGLAAAGFDVLGTDLSPASIVRARREAVERELPARFAVADLRRLGLDVGEQFDAVLTFDNSLAHMLEDAELAAAAAGLAACTRPGGVALASVRPYDRLAAERPATTEPRVSGTPGNRAVSFQVWDWDAEGRTYALEQLMVHETPEGWHTTSHATRLRAVRRAELLAAFAGAGLADVEWLEPATSGFHQPVVVGRRPPAEAQR